MEKRPDAGRATVPSQKKRKKEIFTVHREQYMLRLLHSEKLTFDMLIPKSPYNQSYSKKKSLYMKARRLHPHFTEVAHF